MTKFLLSIDLAVTTARSGMSRSSLSRSGFAPRNTTDRNPLNGTIPVAGVKRYYIYHPRTNPTTVYTEVLS